MCWFIRGIEWFVEMGLTEARRRRRRVEPPRRLPPPWMRKREKPPGCLPKRPPSVSLSFSDIIYLSVLFLYLCTLHVSGRKPQPASRSPPRLLGLLEISKICCIATPPAIAPATPAVKPSSAPTSSQAQEAPGPFAMEVDSGASTKLAVVG